MSISICIGYHFLLRTHTSTKSMDYTVFTAADIFAHYLAPIPIFIDWLLFDTKSTYHWWAPLSWSVIPLIYLICILIRAHKGDVLKQTHTKYPYYFMDIDALGVKAVAINIIAILFMYTMLGYALLILTAFFRFLP